MYGHEPSKRSEHLEECEQAGSSLELAWTPILPESGASDPLTWPGLWCAQSLAP